MAHRDRVKLQRIGKLAEAFALFVASALLVWTSLLYVKLRTTRKGMLWLLPKLFAGGLSLEVALVGLVGAALGTVSGRFSAAIAYALVALVAGIPLLRTWRTREVFTEAFGAIGPDAQDRPYMLRHRWGVRLGSVPDARVRRDVPFRPGTESGRPLLCDIWQPAVEVPPSGLGFIYLHGSAWVMLDKDCGTRPFFTQLAAQGHVVMDVAYRMYPETDIPGMVGDAKRAIAWLRANAAEYAVDPNRIVMGGGSAGGHIALLAAYTAGNPGLTPAALSEVDTSVSGVMTWYSPVDLAACYEHYENAALAETTPEKPDWNAAPSPSMRRLLGADAERMLLQRGPAGGRLDWIIGGTPQVNPEQYARLSPITYARAGCPPTLLMQGRDDIIVPPGPALELQRKLRTAGVQAAVLLLPQADHAFDLMATRWSPMARQALWHAERFLAFIAHTGDSACASGRPVVSRHADVGAGRAGARNSASPGLTRRRGAR